MILEYVEAAMARAHYEIVDDDRTFFAEIPGFEGLWANASTLEECRKELRETLEDWLLVSLKLNKPIPPIANLTLDVRQVA
jgi:predicted RNase H-like HicB family nuclease